MIADSTYVTKGEKNCHDMKVVRNVITMYCTVHRKYFTLKNWAYYSLDLF